MLSPPGDTAKQFRDEARQANQVIAAVGSGTEDDGVRLKLLECLSEHARSEGRAIAPNNNCSSGASGKGSLESRCHPVAEVPFLLWLADKAVSEPVVKIFFGTAVESDLKIGVA